MNFEIKTDIADYYIEITILKYSIDIVINEDKFCGKIHSNKDFNHTAIFTKVIKSRKRSGILTAD